MKVKDLIRHLQLLPQDYEIYTEDPMETGACITLDKEPVVITMVECESNIEYANEEEAIMETYIDRQEYHADDPSVLKTFEAVVFEL